MTNKIELTDRIPYGFPFAAVLRGEPQDGRRIDRPCIVLGYAGWERHYFRIRVGNRVTVACDSMLYVEN